MHSRWWAVGFLNHHPVATYPRNKDLWSGLLKTPLFFLIRPIIHHSFIMASQPTPPKALFQGKPMVNSLFRGWWYVARQVLVGWLAPWLARRVRTCEVTGERVTVLYGTDTGGVTGAVKNRLGHGLPRWLTQFWWLKPFGGFSNGAY